MVFVKDVTLKMGHTAGKFGKCKSCDKRPATEKDHLCDTCRQMGLLTSLLEERTLQAK